VNDLRPARLVAVLGTGTEVGKTWVAAAALTDARAAGLAVAARKPAQSAEPDDPAPSDADVLAGATGEDPLVVCPAHRRYRVAMAPPMAAEVLGLPAFTVADLAAEVTWPAGVDVGVVETAGGVLSPAAEDGTSLDLAAAVGPDELVLVADAGLGTINGVRLSLAAIAAHPGLATTPVVVLLNRLDPDERLHRANRAVLEADAADARTRQGPDVVVDAGALVQRWRHR
jgi:dethiobiotin synthetase